MFTTVGLFLNHRALIGTLHGESPMNRIAALLIVLLGLSACAQTVGETEGVFVYNGTTYRSVERQFVSDNRSFSRRYISVGARTVSCSATDDLDCNAAIRETRERPFDG